ncbi:GGDEF domain-containing protein [Kineococcus glutinatus]|uniref:GGDEF domain-containing protein n=1 Tax=Kineococcus glutinatus TaxID=1070872 RepID=A0ABP9HXD7_9ACTN
MGSPRSVLAVLVVSTAAALVLMTAWGGPAGRLWSMLVSSALAAVLIGVGRRRHRPRSRLPWQLAQWAMALLGVANLASLLRARGGDLEGAAAVVGAAGNGVGWAMVFAAAVVVVRRHATRDAGALCEAAITGSTAANVLWAVVLGPRLQEAGVPAGSRAFTLTVITLVCMTLGAIVQTLRTAPAGRPAFGYLVLATSLGLVGQVAWPLVVPAGVLVGPAWVYGTFVAAYVAVACSALHPAMAHVDLPGRSVEQALTPLRLVYLGAALLCTPTITAVRQLLGLPADGFQALLGSGVAVVLVLVRVWHIAVLRARAEAALAHRASHDGLTGLRNRHAAVEALRAALADCAAGGPGVAVLFCDLDGFKQVNDERGHAAGDALLVGVAARLRAATRPGDVVARLGGDEFLVLTRVDDPEGAAALAERVRRAVVAPDPAAPTPAGTSVGTALVLSGELVDPDAVVAAADASMYADKVARRAGRAPAAPSGPGCPTCTPA